MTQGASVQKQQTVSMGEMREEMENVEKEAADLGPRVPAEVERWNNYLK